MGRSVWAATLKAGLLLSALVHEQTIVQAAAAAAAAPQESVVAGFGAITPVGCYRAADTMTQADAGAASDGWCQQRCGPLKKVVMAITAGTTCLCGDLLPPDDEIVDQSFCKTKCAGYGDAFCGGIGYYQVYLTGVAGAINKAPNSTQTTTSTSSAGTAPAATVVVTQSSRATSPASDSGSSGPNKVGIAVGVVVGLAAIFGIVGVLVFFLRQRKRRAIEEEHKRNAAVNDIIGGKRSEAGSVTDQRLDASFLSSHRRESIGSIADEMDFSRRILQVRNPDHRASTSSHVA